MGSEIEVKEGRVKNVVEGMKRDVEGEFGFDVTFQGNAGKRKSQLLERRSLNFLSLLGASAKAIPQDSILCFYFSVAVQVSRR